MADYAPELKKILRSHGCRFDRQGKGDHEIWFSVISGRHFTVDGKIKSRHSANAVLKQLASRSASEPHSFPRLAPI